uniref:Uncharacterized protein n=1 Tax=Arundo donax TaxID=35708 RepID=A0A0A9DLI5_ARUDO
MHHLSEHQVKYVEMSLQLQFLLFDGFKQCSSSCITLVSWWELLSIFM